MKIAQTVFLLRLNPTTILQYKLLKEQKLGQLTHSLTLYLFL